MMKLKEKGNCYNYSSHVNATSKPENEIHKNNFRPMEDNV